MDMLRTDVTDEQFDAARNDLLFNNVMLYTVYEAASAPVMELLPGVYAGDTECLYMNTLHGLMVLYRRDEGGFRLVTEDDADNLATCFINQIHADALAAV